MMILRYGLKQFFWYPPKVMKFWPKKRTFLLKQWIPFLCFCELPTSVTFNFTFLSRVLRNLFCSYQVRHHQPAKRIIITHTSLQYPFPVQLASILLESVFFYLLLSTISSFKIACFRPNHKFDYQFLFLKTPHIYLLMFIQVLEIAIWDEILYTKCKIILKYYLFTKKFKTY